MITSQPRWPLHRRVVEQSSYLDALMAQLDIAPATAYRLDHGRAIQEARRRCIECALDRQCRAWLAAGESRSEAPAFCPNAGFFAACRPAAG